MGRIVYGLALFVILNVGVRQSVIAQVVINEFLALNTSFILDPEFQEYGDWIELFNDGDTDVDISGYTLTDNLLNPNKWQIPTGTTVQANGFLVIWADGRNTGLHSSFRLSGSGEQIGLFNTEGNPEDTISYAFQQSNLSFGRQPGSSWAFFKVPTPGKMNTEEGFAGISEKPRFSSPGGFYDGPVSLNLSSSAPGAVIRFTTDGSEPDTTSLQFFSTLSVTSTMTIRAKTYEQGKLPGKTVNHSYFINEPDHDLPVISISTDPENLWDSQSGIYINFTEDWERPCGLEFFNPEGESAFSINAGVKIFGGTSRNSAQKSLSVYARNRYGDGAIQYTLLPGRKTEVFKSFILRNSANDWQGNWRGTMFRDGLIHTVVENQMDLDYQSYRPVVVYLNGAYWGIHNIRDKHNEDYLQIKYGIDRDSVDIIKQNQVISGDDVFYNEMMNYLANNDLYTDDNYQVAVSMIDIDEFINYMITEIYSCNIDWPANNYRLWRPTTESGKWRWMLFDTEFGYNGFQWAPATTNMFNKALDPDIDDYVNQGLKAPWATRAFIKLTQNESFRKQFVSTYLSHIYTTYVPERVAGIVDSLRENLLQEMPRHIARWGAEGGIFSMQVWQQNVQGMRDFAWDRPAFALQHLKETFDIQEKDKVRLDLVCDKGGNIILNGIPLDQSHFTGDYYLGLPVKLDIQPWPGYDFKGWTIVDSSHSGTTLVESREMETIIEGDVTIIAGLVRSQEIPDLRINEIMASNSSGIEDEFGDKDDWIEVYNAGAEIVDLGGLFMTDTLGEPGLWEIPVSEPSLTSVEPGSFIVFWADNEPEQGPLHLGFKLRKSGEQVGLFKELEGSLILLDSVTYSTMLADVSLARYPDATGPWVAFAHPTPLDPNFYLGMKDRDKPSGEFSVYPNPTSGLVNIGGLNFETLIPGDDLRVTVLNHAGKMIIDRRIHSLEGVEIDLSAHKAGLYLIRIFTGESYFTKQIILLK